MASGSKTSAWHGPSPPPKQVRSPACHMHVCTVHRGPGLGCRMGTAGPSAAEEGAAAMSLLEPVAHMHVRVIHACTQLPPPGPPAPASTHPQ